MFKIKDYIICGKYGVCKVEDIGPVQFSAASEKKLFYTLVPVYDSNSKTYVPVDSEKVLMRAVITEPQAQELMKHVEDIEELWTSDDKKREVAFKEALGKCDCIEWIRIIKTVCLRRRERTAQGKKITANDERYLRMAQEYLYGELGVALRMDGEELNNYISDFMKEVEGE